MDVANLRAFFMWCTILNAGLLILSFLICASAGDLIHRIHSRWFPISKEAFYVAIYSWLAFFKLVVIALNFVPYLALVIIG